MSVMPIPSTPRMLRPGPRLWSTQQFDELVKMGMFDGEKVELIEGELFEVPPMSDPHAQAVRLGQYALLQIFPPTETTISVQLPMRLPSGSRPLPDLAVVRGTPREVVEHPTTAQLVIEISDSTLEFDRLEKGQLYARNGIIEYWIVNLIARTVEVRREPSQSSTGVFEYRSIRAFYPGEVLVPLARPDHQLRVDDFLPTLTPAAQE